MLAYLDAGSASVVVSAVAAGAAGVGVVAKMGANRLRGAFGMGRRRAEAAPDEVEEQQHES